ncbi:MAG: SDR family oxidoreductase [Spirochaetaceae bacterium]|nr:SDR family oxidoreductase [Spirochaetaceae bacterium]
MAAAERDGRPVGAAGSLAGKYALVTGSTQGLGAATARAFAERGAAGVVVTGRDAERGRAVAGELSGLGCDARFVAGDLACLDDCRNLVAAADRAFGTLHVLVNAAALTERSTIWDTTPEFYERVMDINVRAPFFLTQAAVKVMQREGVAGSIVNVSSVAAHGGEPMLCPYSISKAALNAMTKNVAYSVMRHRIRVNALNLGWMDTPGEDAIQRRYHTDGGDWLADAEAAQPFGRLIQPAEVARTIAYLASEESGVMTGALIDYDQSVFGAGRQPIPPPMDEWPSVAGVSFA